MKSNRSHNSATSHHLLCCFILEVILITHQVRSAYARAEPLCPISPTDEHCVEVYDPVLCGKPFFACKYDNQCFATAASKSFTAETCNKLCPDPNWSTVVGCVKLYDPVKCGENFECVYNNQCIATAASRDFSTRTCKKLDKKPSKVCPAPGSSNDNDIICIWDVSPVRCGEYFECEYSNQCVATTASKDFTWETCKKLNEKPSNACPSVRYSNDDDKDCTGDYDPVKCGENLECEYFNQCYATSASSDFTAETCKETFCPKEVTNRDIVCTHDYDPVRCGENFECVYNNQCYAKAVSSEFTWETCKKLNEKPSNACPSVRYSNGKDCTEDYDPVKCGENLECEYFNQCYATSASSDFTAETCKESTKTPNKVCPKSSHPCTEENIQLNKSKGELYFCPQSSCIEKYDPVKCGENFECEYDNQCLAKLASEEFTTETCKKIGKPPSNACPPVWAATDDDVTCATYSYDRDPVKCGDLKCEYDNQCYATSASSDFTEETCELLDDSPNKVCPPEKSSYDDIVCSKTYYDPVKCGDLECEYDNPCLAKAASKKFTAKTCKKVCPESPNDKACTTAYDPVKCGDLECVYKNQCLATAASKEFTAETCKQACTIGNNIFLHKPCDDEDSVCEDSTSYRFKLENGNERRCSFISKKQTRKRQEMYCKGETATECCNACKKKECTDKSDFKFKLKNGKSADCSWFEKGKPKMKGKRKSRYCKGKVKRKCCESCA